jgi:hypothetical protein
MRRMVDDATSGGGSPGARCQWCSAELPAPDVSICPYCAAPLSADTDAQLPGVTAVDAEAIARATRAPVRPPRNRLLSWISGEYTDDDEAPAALDALAPPDGAVRREMLRLQLEAEIAARRADAEALIAEAVAEGRPVPAAVAGLGVADGALEVEPDAEPVATAEGAPVAEAAEPPTDAGDPDPR